jgi:transposase
VQTRLQKDEATHAHAERRRTEGKTAGEIKRCLEHYVTRQLYRILETKPSTLHES